MNVSLFLVAHRPYLVKVSQIGLNSLLVSWTYRPYWPPVAGFNIFYNQQNGGDNGSVTVENNNNYTTITGLIALATYSISVVAIPSTLPGPPSTSIIIVLGIYYLSCMNTIDINDSAILFQKTMLV